MGRKAPCPSSWDGRQIWPNLPPVGIWPSQMFLQPFPLACPPSRVYLQHIFLTIQAPFTKGHFAQASASAWREPKDLILTLISLRFGIPGSSLPYLVILRPRPASVVSALRTRKPTDDAPITLSPLGCRGNHRRANAHRSWGWGMGLWLLAVRTPNPGSYDLLRNF